MKKYVIVGGIVAFAAFATLWGAYLRYKVYWGEPARISTSYGCGSKPLVPAPEKGYNKKKVICVDPFEFEVGTLEFGYRLAGGDTTVVRCFGVKGENYYLVMAKPDSTVVVASLPRIAQ